MLRKISVAIVGTMLLSGVAAAAPFTVQPTPTFPASVNETGPNYASPTTSSPRLVAGRIGAPEQVQTPSSVSESMPEMTGGQSHPTMGIGATRAAKRTLDVGATVPAAIGPNVYPIIGD